MSISKNTVQAVSMQIERAHPSSYRVKIKSITEVRKGFLVLYDTDLPPSSIAGATTYERVCFFKSDNGVLVRSTDIILDQGE